MTHRSRAIPKQKKAGGPEDLRPSKSGAGEEIRTLDSHLGKVVLYQLSYARAEESQNIDAQFPRVNRKDKVRIKTEEL